MTYNALLIISNEIDVCQFSNGYGYGGLDEQVGTATDEQECAANVQQKRPTANGATFYPVSKKCFAEHASDLQISRVQFYARACIFPGTNYKDRF